MCACECAFLCNDHLHSKQIWPEQASTRALASGGQILRILLKPYLCTIMMINLVEEVDFLTQHVLLA